MPKPWLLALVTAGGLIAVLIGVAQATSNSSETFVLCIDKNVVRPVNGGESCKSKEHQLEVYTKSGTDAAILAAGGSAGSSNADTLDDLDSTAFVRVGDPIDAATLDGLDSTAFAAATHNHDDAYYTKAQADSLFLAAGGTSTDSNKLGGYAADAFARKGALAFDLTAIVPAGSCLTSDQLVPFALEPEAQIVNVFSPGLPSGVFIRGAKVVGANLIRLDLCNVTGAPLGFSNVPVEYTTIR